MWRPRRQGHPLDPSRVDDLLKGGAVFPVPVMDEILAGRQETPLLHRHVAGDLHHPRLIGMRRHACHVDLPTSQMDERLLLDSRVVDVTRSYNPTFITISS